MKQRTYRVRRLVAALAAIIAGWGLVSWDASPPSFELYVKRSLVTDRPSITLADIILSAPGKPYSIDLSAVRLELTPDRLTVLGTGYIRDLLEPHYSGELIIVGRETTVIPASVAAGGAVAPFEELGSFLAAAVNLPRARLETEWTTGTLPALPAANDAAFRIDFSGRRDGVKAGPAVLSFRSKESGGGWSGEAGLVLHVFARVAVPVATLRKGDRFRESDLDARFVDLSRFQEELLPPGRISGVMTAAQTLPAGEPIPVKKIARALFVRPGDRVALTFVKKNIVIARSGRALSSGSLDDRVSVKAEGADRRFEGLVTGDKEVRVELP